MQEREQGNVMRNCDKKNQNLGEDSLTKEGNVILSKRGFGYKSVDKRKLTE